MYLGICFLLDLSVVFCLSNGLEDNSSIRNNIAVFSDCSGSCESDVLLVPITIDVSSVFNLQQEYNVSDSNKVTASLVRCDLTVVASQVIN